MLSLQQHENIRRKELFQAVLSLCRLPSVKAHALQPYIKVGRQYVLVKYTADISLMMTTMMILMIIITSGQSNLTKGCIANAHGQFSGIRQVAPVCTHLIHASLGPLESISQTASGSVQPLLHSSWQSVVIFYKARHFFPLKLSLPIEGSEQPSNTWFLGPTQVVNQNAILIGSFLQDSLVW